MAPVGQPETHSPQAVHTAGSTFARLFSMETACEAQPFTHLVQAMHPLEQAARTLGPFS